MSMYAFQIEAYYMKTKEFLYSKFANNPKLKNATTDELTNLVLSENWKLFLPDGIKRTTIEKAIKRVLYMTNQENI